MIVSSLPHDTILILTVPVHDALGQCHSETCIPTIGIGPGPLQYTQDSLRFASAGVFLSSLNNKKELSLPPAEGGSFKAKGINTLWAQGAVIPIAGATFKLRVTLS